MLFQHILSWYGIQRVSQLMGHACIDNAKKFILSSLLVEHDAIGDVNYLDYGLGFQACAFDLHVSILWLARTIPALLKLTRTYFEYHVFDWSVVDSQNIIKTKLIFILLSIHASFLCWWKLELIEDIKIKELVLFMTTNIGLMVSVTRTTSE